MICAGGVLGGLLFCAALKVCAQASGPPASGEPLSLDDPAVAAIVGSNPIETRDVVRAVDLLSRLGRADLAKGYLQKLVESTHSMPVS
jgi:hypothetical protein